MQSNFPKIPLFVSMILFCGFLFAFLFFYGMINKNSEKAQASEKEWQNEVKRRDEIKYLDRSIKLIENEIAELGTHFAQSSDIVPFLDKIEELARKAGTKAEVTSVDIPKDENGLLVGVKASGAFGDVYKFLVLLENSPYELEFLSVDFKKDAGLGAESSSTGAPKWNAFFRIKLLSFMP